MTNPDEMLKACPLCGDKDDYNPSVSPSYKYAEPGDVETGKVGNPAAGLVLSGYYVECDKCGCCGPHKSTKARAAAAWNQRASIQPADDAVVSALRDARNTLTKTATSNIEGDQITLARSWFNSAVRNIDKALAALAPQGEKAER